MEKEEEIDFDLPEIEEKKPAKPKIHIGGDTCVSCEG